MDFFYLLFSTFKVLSSILDHLSSSAVTALLKVRVLSPRESYIIENVASVSSVNSAGPFDILPGHAKFVTYVEKNPFVLRLSDGTTRELVFDLFILHVREDQVDVYTNPASAGIGLA